MMKFLLALLLAFQFTAAAAITIDTNAVIPFKDSYRWNAGINFQPGDGETVTLNPPKFGWLYATNMPWSPEVQAISTFVLQISTNSNFSDFIVNTATPYNFYNYLAPLPTGVTIYWRVVYKNLAGSTIFTSASRTFTVSPSAVEWDRSMLADSSYLTSKATHPYMLFNSANKAAVSAWVLDAYANRDNAGTANYIRQAGKQYNYTKFYADTAIAATWMTNYVTTNNLIDFTTRAQSLGDVAFVWHMTGSSTYTNKDPMQQLYYTADYFIKADLWKQDPVAVQNTFAIEHIALAYDMFYNALTSDQRTLIRRAISLYCHYSYEGAWRNRTWRNIQNEANWEAYALTGSPYTDGYYVTMDSPEHQGSSHWHDQHYTAFRSGIAIYNEDTWGRLATDFGLNYLVNRGSPFADQAGVNQGRSYGVGGFGSVLNAFIRAQIVFPEAQFVKSPILQSNAFWWDYMIPLGYLHGHDQWGDSPDYAATYDWNRAEWGRNFALISSNGIAWQHYTNAIGSFITDDNYAQQNHEATYLHVALPYHFPPPATASNTNSAMLFPADGWAFVNSQSPTTFAGYTNGVGLIFCARPRGSEEGHSHNTELSFQIWAYGANVTDAGGEYAYPISKVPEGHYSLMVDGFGPVQGEFSHREPYASKFIGFTNSSTFAYVAADGTLAYPRKAGIAPISNAFVPEPYKTQLQSLNKLSYLSLVKREILMPRKKYFVIRDTLATTQPATFSWLYHILPNTLNLNAGGRRFSYTVPNQYHGSNVTVYVAHLSSLAGLSVTNMTGANVSRNPVTGTNFLSGSHPRSSALWFSNASAATNWVFTYVIYPQKWDASAPTITRIDDDTVRVVAGTDDDTVSFNVATATANGATYIVDMGQAASGGGDVGGGGGEEPPPVTTNSVPTLIKGGGKLKGRGGRIR